MKITLEPTSRTVEVMTSPAGASARARVWEGVTDAGTPVQLLVLRAAPMIEEPLPAAVAAEFEAALANCRKPIALQEAFPLRMIL